MKSAHFRYSPLKQKSFSFIQTPLYQSKHVNRHPKFTVKRKEKEKKGATGNFMTGKCNA